jgi:menaquinone reductase, integral membrane subunit
MTTTTAPAPPYERIRRGLSVYWLWVGLLLVMCGIGLAAGIIVLLTGLGVTNLSDQVPWGLWITVDLSSIALGAGAFSLSALIYLARIRVLAPIARMAVFTGLIGYTGAMLALVMDIGRPDRFWHPIIYPNMHSVLWEITLCVMLYTVVLLTEFAPIVFESDFMKRIFPRGPEIGHFLHRFAPIAAVFGLGLSLLHQSSLGATYGILVARPIWFRPTLPVMFIVSAVGAGSTAVLGITVLYENIIKRRVIGTQTRNALATFAASVLLASLYLTLWDYLSTNYYSHLPARVESLYVLDRVAPFTSTFWLFEVLLGTLIPAIVLMWPRLRKLDTLVMMVAVFAIIGIIVNRWNVTLSGLIAPMDWSHGVAEVFPANSYQPSWIEWGVVTGVVGYILLAFTLALRFLPMYPFRTPEEAEAAEHAHSDHHTEPQHAALPTAPEASGGD